jgi:hypothetical protein
MTPQERLKILYERVRDFRINEDQVLSELRRLLLVFDGYSEGPRTYYRKQIITVLGQMEECGGLCFETRPVVLGHLHGAAQVAGELIEIKQRATIGAYCIESLWAKRRTKNSRPKTTGSACYSGAANERAERARSPAAITD